MKWYNCKEKLPPIYTKVLVCREIRVSGFNPMLTYDFGMIRGIEACDRWELGSQYGLILPQKPTIGSGIVTHWARLPKLPDREKVFEEAKK